MGELAKWLHPRRIAGQCAGNRGIQFPQFLAQLLTGGIRDVAHALTGLDTIERVFRCPGQELGPARERPAQVAERQQPASRRDHPVFAHHGPPDQSAHRTGAPSGSMLNPRKP
jgi:hypothetical protein